MITQKHTKASDTAKLINLNCWPTKLKILLLTPKMTTVNPEEGGLHDWKLASSFAVKTALLIPSLEILFCIMLLCTFSYTPNNTTNVNNEFEGNSPLSLGKRRTRDFLLTSLALWGIPYSKATLVCVWVCECACICPSRLTGQGDLSWGKLWSLPPVPDHPEWVTVSPAPLVQHLLEQPTIAHIKQRERLKRSTKQEASATAHLMSSPTPSGLPVLGCSCT